MKAEQYFLVNERVRGNAIAHISELQADGKVKVVISDAGTKSARQRGLQWQWYTEVAAAGIGGRHEDTKKGVHRVSKWRWAIPILTRDDDFFAELFAAWHAKHGLDEKRMEWFVDHQVHTEGMSTSQMAEFLTDFQIHYSQFVKLTDPDERDLLDWKKRYEGHE